MGKKLDFDQSFANFLTNKQSQIKRYKRFFVDIKIKNQIITAHCPNTGSMSGLLNKGNRVWISKSDNPNRKLKYTLEIIECGKSKVGVNTHSSNKIVCHALKKNLIEEEFYTNILTHLITFFSSISNIC